MEEGSLEGRGLVCHQAADHEVGAVTKIWLGTTLNAVMRLSGFTLHEAGTYGACWIGRPNALKSVLSRHI